MNKSYEFKLQNQSNTIKIGNMLDDMWQIHIHIYVVVSQVLWICFSCENVDGSKLKPKTGKSAGFEYGNKTFLTSDEGNKIESPQFFKQSLNTL